MPLDGIDVVTDNGIERSVLIEELGAFLDVGALQIYHYRVAGESWTSIGEKLKIAPTLAKSRFYESLARAKTRVLGPRKPPPGKHEWE